MPTGSYNISRLIDELGLKNVSGLEVVERIQPTLALNSMAGQLPVHVAGSAIFGAAIGPFIAEHGGLQIQSLDPGGFVVQFVQSTTVQTFVLEVKQVPAVFGAIGPIACAAEQMNSGPPTLSTCNVGTVALGPPTTAPVFAAGVSMPGGKFAPFLVPRGQFLMLTTRAQNVSALYAVGITGIAATESGE